MKDYQERVLAEHRDLYTKIEKLKDFMHGDTFASLDAVNRGLLMVQIVAMQNYLDALERRIEQFG